MVNLSCDPGGRVLKNPMINNDKDYNLNPVIREHKFTNPPTCARYGRSTGQRKPREVAQGTLSLELVASLSFWLQSSCLASPRQLYHKQASKRISLYPACR